MKSLRCVFLPVFAIAFVLTLRGGGQDPRAGNDEPVKVPGQSEVTVTLRLIQVYVSGKDGKPVTDLERADFSLSDNGKLQKITDFERHLVGVPTPADETAPAAPVRMTRKLFLLFDLAFNDLGGVAMSKKTALDFIDTQAGPADEIGVLSYANGVGLRLHEYLTPDRAKAREAVLDVDDAATMGRAGQLMQGIMEEKAPKKDNSLGPVNPESVKKNLIRTMGIPQFRHEVQAFSSAVRDFAKAVRRIPGYKYIVLFSRGVPDYLMYLREPTTSRRPQTP